MKNKTSENHRELIRQASKIVSHEWKSHREILSRFQAIETSRLYLLLRINILNSRWVPLSKCVGLK